MGQFDFPSAAALARLQSEALLTSPVSTVASTLVNIGSRIAELAGFHGAAPLTGLIQDLKGLAAAKDENNLTYFGEHLVDDIRRLYAMNEEMRRRVERLPESTEFDAAVANATLHIARTNIETRLVRVARLIANGVRSDDLSSEPLDDMMRSAVELKDADIILLGQLYELWKPLLDRVRRAKTTNSAPPNFHNEIQNVWHGFGRSLNPAEQLEYRGSFARLESHGMIQQVAFSNNEVGREPYVILEGGATFYERLQEFGTNVDLKVP